MENKKISQLEGWGHDADEQNDPTYPIRKRANEEHQGSNWDRPEQQPQTIEVLRSIERPNISAVFGTDNPPSGLSGMIRRKAFEYSESSLVHWFQLILADRVNVIEGLVDDIKRGHFPNLFAEKGLGAEWKYNRKAFVTKLATSVLITTSAIALIGVFKRKK